GLAGPARASVGSVRDYVLGATLLNGRAEVLSFGGQVIKNVAGYDVARLLAGSMGLLGVICEVSIKVLPVAPASVTLRFDCEQAEAIERLQAWGGQPLPLHASAWWQGALIVRLSGAVAAVESACKALGGEAIEARMAQRFWSGLRDQTDEFFNQARRALTDGAALWRISVPAGAPPLALPGEQLIEWGGAQRWFVSRASAAVVRQVAAQHGGHATLFRAKDKAAILTEPGRVASVFEPLQAPLDRIHAELKLSFDPDRLFNPGRLYPGL
ncbi:MAG: glycolate oxidase subunit GlcE, partial [Leptothrix sp. (in: b-proteobacteria)]